MSFFRDKENSPALIAFAVFLLIAYLFPYHVSPFRAFYNDWLAIFGVVIGYFYFLREKTIALQIPWIVVLPLGLIVVILLQVSMGMPMESWDEFFPIAYLFVSIMAIILGSNIASNKGFEQLCFALSAAHLFAGLVSVIIASLQLSGVESAFSPFVMLMAHARGAYSRPYANIAQSNQLALLFCLSIASIWWLFQTKAVGSKAAVAAVLALLWGLAITQSRIGWLIIPLYATFNWFSGRKNKFRRVPNWIAIGLSAVYAAFVIIVLPAFSSLLNTQVMSIAEHVSGHSVRAVLYEQALRMSLNRPWFGVGWFQFGPRQLVLAPSFPQAEYAHYAHDIILNFAAEVGWPITVFVVGILIYWFFKTCSACLVSKEIGFSTLFFMAVLIHSLVEYPLWYAFVLMPVGLLMGAVHQEQLGSTKISISRPYLAPLVVVAAATLLAVAADYRRVVAGFSEMEMESVGMTLNPHAIEKPVMTIFPYVYDYFKFMNTTPHEDMSADEIAFAERTSSRFGGALVLTKLSQIYALNGRADDAVRVMSTIQHLHTSSSYRDAYEEWRHAPPQYQFIFKRLPPPHVRSEK